MTLPYLDYADVIFYKVHSKDLDKLQRLQNQCLKICSGWDILFSTDLAHKQSHVPFLRDRRKAHKLNFMYKSLSREDLLNNREIRTRAHDAPLFSVNIPRCEAFKRSVGYSGSVAWNELQLYVTQQLMWNLKTYRKDQCYSLLVNCNCMTSSRSID